MIVKRTSEGKLVITPVPGTERDLPLTKAEAVEWVSRIPGDMPEEVRQNQIQMLCSEDK
jgi:hypothetical protein